MTPAQAAWVRRHVIPPRRRAPGHAVCACQWPPDLCHPCRDGRCDRCVPAWGFEQPVTWPPYHCGGVALVWLADRVCKTRCCCGCSSSANAGQAFAARGRGRLFDLEAP